MHNVSTPLPTLQNPIELRQNRPDGGPHEPENPKTIKTDNPKALQPSTLNANPLWYPYSTSHINPCSSPYIDPLKAPLKFPQAETSPDSACVRGPLWKAIPCPSSLGGDPDIGFL